jgi:hypothetical protein
MSAPGVVTQVGLCLTWVESGGGPLCFAAVAAGILTLHKYEGLRRVGSGYPDLPMLPYCRHMPSGRLMSRAA